VRGWPVSLPALKIAGVLVVAVAILAAQAAPSGRLNQSLLSAAEAGNVTAVRSLLKRGASPNSANSDGNTITALMLAARGGHSSVVRLLLEAGADVNATATVPGGVSSGNTGLTALMEASASGDPTTVELLLVHKADPAAKSTFVVNDSTGATNAAGCSPVIMQAANLAVLRVLAEHGADLHVKDCDGNSVLMFAAQNLDPPALQYLLSKGLDPQERNHKGLTALDLAKQAEETGNIEILKKAAH
jgi:ankyrin repeat protein